LKLPSFGKEHIGKTKMAKATENGTTSEDLLYFPIENQPGYFKTAKLVHQRVFEN